MVKNWKFREGGGAYVKFPPWWGYGYFLELHILTTKFSLDRKRRSHKRNGKKWKRSDSSDSNSVELMTPLTTPIFDFH